MSTSYAARPRQRSASRERIATRRQRLSTVEIVTLIVIAALLIAGAVTAGPHVQAPAATKTVQVQTGDTLWSIARAHPISGLSTAQTVDSIVRDNSLPSATLSAGQQLVVVAQADSAPQVASR